MTDKNGNDGTWRTATADSTRRIAWLVATVPLVFFGTACGNDGEGPIGSPGSTGSASASLSAQIPSGQGIQIDGPPNGADLYANVGTPLNTGATLDWVDELTGNVSTGCLDPMTSIASCNEAGVTAHSSGQGTWHGVRFVDSFGNGEQDQFLMGGKENDTSTWHVGAGSVGSSKYDVTQAYLAYDTDDIYFAGERRGNNGTTVFEAEFNQLAPSDPSCAPNPDPLYVPCRSQDDVLFAFEMQGSGNTGSATPYVFTWNAMTSSWDPVALGAMDLLASINDSTTTAAGPWGRVDSHGDWDAGPLDRFQFGEMVAPLDVLSGISQCGGQAWVQIRSRSSISDTSDLKDAFKIVQIDFANLQASASLGESCDGTLTYGVTASDANGPIMEADLTCVWNVPGLSPTGCSGTLMGVAPGTYSGTVAVSLTAVPECTQTPNTGNGVVHTPITASILPDTTSAMCSPDLTSDAVTFTATASGGDGPLSYSWSGCTVNPMNNTMCTVDPADGDFCADATVMLTASDGAGLCPDVPATPWTYSKVTTISAAIVVTP